MGPGLAVGVMVFVGPVLLWSAYRLARLVVAAVRARRWEPVPAAVTSVEFTPGRDRAEFPTRDRWVITYRYRAFEEFYTGRARYDGSPPPAEGDRVRAYVDPRRPERRFFVEEERPRAMAFAHGASLLISGALLGQAVLALAAF
ncbi:DUF3592 domain-containing protein [Luteipulveratus flavus]|uniref:DUF3592 domain-containing protein n=1 Tax=Luteipulveratus flavus TaxID=3031728 RepID=A0ABT6CA84_9MICO|nr:DUF3592 domain-containing protein [Luteipulveratus sp. YIM 133296]MDF8265656.1 DUF3592 domain-containing protein [Luteipulveratus sp. YIM 133296]